MKRTGYAFHSDLRSDSGLVGRSPWTARDAFVPLPHQETRTSARARVTLHYAGGDICLTQRATHLKRYWMACMLLTATAAFSQILPSGLGSRWWRAPQMAEKLGLTPEQQTRMDDVFQQSRLKLIDLTASLDKEEAMLEPLLSPERPDANKIRAQIGRVADARAELEKANANMLLGLRLLLSPDQWKKLQAGSTGPRPRKLGNGDESPPTPRKR